MCECTCLFIYAPKGSKDPPPLPCKPKKGSVWQTAVAYTSAPLDRGRVTSSRVLMHWQTVSAWELLRNSLACTPMGGMPLRVNTVLQSLVASSFALVYHCPKWLGVLGVRSPWQPGAAVPKVCYTLESFKNTTHGDLLKILTSGSPHPETFHPFNPQCPSMQWAECLHLPPNSYWNPGPQSNGIWGWDFGKIIRSRGWGPRDEISALVRRDRRELACSLCVMWGYKKTSANQDQGPHPTPNLPAPGSRTSWPLVLWEINFCC